MEADTLIADKAFDADALETHALLLAEGPAAASGFRTRSSASNALSAIKVSACIAGRR